MPEPPALPAATVAELTAYADATVAWLEEELGRGRAHGHEPSFDQYEQIAGYRFLAQWCRDAYDD